ncbi:MAG: metallophosphoesterase family protein [Saccharofermentanales bacterium]
MKLALLADIHSNYIALEECLNFIENERFDGILFLGDYVSDCPYPRRTMKLIYECKKNYKCWFVRGNREEYLLDYNIHKSGWKYSSNNGSLLYTYENLSEEDMAFFESMSICSKVEIDDFPAISICHGSPNSTREWLYAKTELTDKYLQDLATDYLFCGHTHRPFKYSAFGKTLINCASVGASTNCQTNAQFVKLEFVNGIWSDELISVPYDIGRLINEFDSSGLNDKCFMWSRSFIKLLQTGEDYTLRCVELAIKIALREDENVNIYDLPEEYWLQAAKELDII